MKQGISPIILALDTNELSVAISWIEATRDSIDVYKVGLEFFLKYGQEGLKELAKNGDFEFFLDLKLHDIPHTVSGAVNSIKELEPRFLTVHAAGGSAMIRAAADAAPNISITAVTVLTSLDPDELQKIGIDSTPLDLAGSMARNSVSAGALAIVCSPHEVSAIRNLVGSEITLITPGVRPVDSELGDQSRVMTPQQAMRAGANFIVIGRPITSFFLHSPEAMRDRATEILESLS